METEKISSEKVTELLDSNFTMAILGDRDTAKTNLLFYLAKHYKGNRKIVFFGYPKNIGFERVFQLSKLGTITNSVIFMDELQRFIKIYNNSTNGLFLDILCMMAHQNNTLVFSTPLTQAITKSTDNFIDCYIYTKIKDLGALKNGSKAKRLLQNSGFPMVNQLSIALNIGQFIVISETIEGIYSFENMGIGKDWITFSQKNPKIFPKKSQ